MRIGELGKVDACLLNERGVVDVDLSVIVDVAVQIAALGVKFVDHVAVRGNIIQT